MLATSSPQSARSRPALAGTTPWLVGFGAGLGAAKAALWTAVWSRFHLCRWSLLEPNFRALSFLALLESGLRGVP